MSWSVSFIGSPEKVAGALRAESDKLYGDSKTEYDAALPHLVGLVQQNVSKGVEQAIRLTANGHAYSENGELKQSICQVTIEALFGAVL